MNEYSGADLMAAIRSLHDATALGFTNMNAKFEALDARVDSKVEGLRSEMNRRFDRVDLRFDAVEGRLERLEHAQPR
jgi:hypothetical protein